MVKRYDAGRAHLLRRGRVLFPDSWPPPGAVHYSVTRYMRKTDSTVSNAIFTSNQSDQFSM
jgi:hypothetical protein